MYRKKNFIEISECVTEEMWYDYFENSLGGKRERIIQDF